jgi:addiction module HigA family antidote
MNPRDRLDTRQPSHRSVQPQDANLGHRAKALRLTGIYEAVRGKRAVSADVALRLGKYFDITPKFWMNLQTDYDLRLAATSAPLNKIKPRQAA